jgi:DNA-binding MarR family transcriptional regulator
MHTTAFAMKRGFQSWLRFARPLAARFDLTPARYDMLFAIDTALGGEVLQSALRGILGVSAPTISKMLGSLEELGLVRREVYRKDRRERVVRLTDDGRRSLDVIEHELVASGRIELAISSALCGRYAILPRKCAAMRQRIERKLRSVRDQFRDEATLDFTREPAPQRRAVGHSLAC